MALSVTVNRRDVERAIRVLDAMDPRRDADAINRGFRRIALEIAADAAANQIIRGGRFGGVDSPPNPKKLTSRSGRLRSSLSGRRAIDDSQLPKRIIVGTSVEYGPVHELGLEVRTRSGSTFRMPRRPFLEPAVDAVLPRMADIMLEEWLRVVDKAGAKPG